MAWINLPSDQKEVFNNIAAKDGDPSMDGYDWFDHLVPSELQDNAAEVETFMNGGTVTQEVWVYDQGRGSGHYETVTHEISDKDVSRIESGANGGEYTTDNTIMEDSSINRARGADNMTGDELEAAEAAVEADTVLIDGATEFSAVADSTVETMAVSGAEAADSFVDVVLDGVLPVTYGAKAAQAVWESTEGMDDGERLAVTALGGGAAVATTYTALAVIPGLNLVLGGVALWKLGEAIYNASQAEEAKKAAKKAARKARKRALKAAKA